MFAGNLVISPVSVKRMIVRSTKVILGSAMSVERWDTFLVTVPKEIVTKGSVTTVELLVTSPVTAQKQVVVMVVMIQLAIVVTRKATWPVTAASVSIVASSAISHASVSKLPKIHLSPRCSLFVSQCLHGDKISSSWTPPHSTATVVRGFAAITRWRHLLLLWCTRLYWWVVVVWGNLFIFHWSRGCSGGWGVILILKFYKKKSYKFLIF